VDGAIPDTGAPAAKAHAVPAPVHPPRHRRAHAAAPEPLRADTLRDEDSFAPRFYDPDAAADAGVDPGEELFERGLADTDERSYEGDVSDPDAHPLPAGGERAPGDGRRRRRKRRSRGRAEPSAEPVAVTCTTCSAPFTVNFVPRADKPIYCDPCYAQRKAERHAARAAAPAPADGAPTA
jgi:CxxC-x17-CxxC domain-containing protein